MLKLLSKKWQRIKQVASTQETQNAAQKYTNLAIIIEKIGKGAEVLN